MTKKVLYFSLLIILIQSCGSSSSVTNNFSIQKRKYNKGWNVKDLFQHKQNDEASVVDVKSKNQDKEQVLVKNEKLKTELVQENSTYQLESEITATASNVKTPELVVQGDLKEPMDNPSLENSKISESEHLNTTSDSTESSKTLKDKSEKIPDMLFRVFFIIGFSIAIITIILTLLNLAGDAALAFLVVLFFADITSLFIVLALLIRRAKNENLYKEPGYLVVFTEILFGIISVIALATWVNNAFG
ncbi:MAG: hypothetical protein RI922_106 [Bacteroidota bacterium]|jgi:hypothetical protein